MEHPWEGGIKVCIIVQVTWPIWSPCPYMVKPLKIFFSRTGSPMILKLCMQHRGLKFYKVYINSDPGLTSTYFTARSNLVPYAFVWEKGKTTDFSETIVIYDLKLATDDRSDKTFLLTSKLCPLGAVCPPAPGLCTCIKSWKKYIKSDFKEISLKLATEG